MLREGVDRMRRILGVRAPFLHPIFLLLKCFLPLLTFYSAALSEGKYEHNRMNIWEGTFPSENLLLDGHHGKYRLQLLPLSVISTLISTLNISQ